MVDLPGYGYAAAPKAEKATWSKLVDGYLGGARPLKGVIALFDVRRQPDQRDLALIEMFRKYQLVWQAVWTKADKMKKSGLSRRSKELDDLLSTSNPGIAFSSKTRLGRDALLDWIERCGVD